MTHGKKIWTWQCYVLEVIGHKGQGIWMANCMKRAVDGGRKRKNFLGIKDIWSLKGDVNAYVRRRDRRFQERVVKLHIRRSE